MQLEETFDNFIDYFFKKPEFPSSLSGFYVGNRGGVGMGIKQNTEIVLLKWNFVQIYSLI